jgi:hypothetical protein
VWFGWTSAPLVRCSAHLKREPSSFSFHRFLRFKLKCLKKGTANFLRNRENELLPEHLQIVPEEVSGSGDTHQQAGMVTKFSADEILLRHFYCISTNLLMKQGKISVILAKFRPFAFVCTFKCLRHIFAKIVLQTFR